MQTFSTAYLLLIYNNFDSVLQNALIMLLADHCMNIYVKCTHYASG